MAKHILCQADSTNLKHVQEEKVSEILSHLSTFEIEVSNRTMQWFNLGHLSYFNGRNLNFLFSSSKTANGSWQEKKNWTFLLLWSLRPCPPSETSWRTLSQVHFLRKPQNSNLKNVFENILIYKQYFISPASLNSPHHFNDKGPTLPSWVWNYNLSPFSCNTKT